MLGVIVFACGEGIETAGKAVNWRVEGGIIFIGKDDVEVSVQLRSSELSEVFGYKREAYEFSLVTLGWELAQLCRRLRLSVTGFDLRD